MIGFIVRHLGKEYRAGVPDSWVCLMANLQRGIFNLHAGNEASFLDNWMMAREGIEFEVEVAEFDQASEIFTADNYKELGYKDPEYQKIVDSRDENWEWEWKLELFRKFEAILTQEGLL